MSTDEFLLHIKRKTKGGKSHILRSLADDLDAGRITMTIDGSRENIEGPPQDGWRTFTASKTTRLEIEFTRVDATSAESQPELTE